MSASNTTDYRTSCILLHSVAFCCNQLYSSYEPFAFIVSTMTARRLDTLPFDVLNIIFAPLRRENLPEGDHNAGLVPKSKYFALHPLFLPKPFKSGPNVPKENEISRTTDLKNLSRLNKAFRNLLTPEIFLH